METANVSTVAMNLRLVIENFMKVGNPNAHCVELPANKYSVWRANLY